MILQEQALFGTEGKNASLKISSTFYQFNYIFLLLRRYMGKIWDSSFHTIALMAFYYVVRWVNRQGIR